jgi:hypothetical protein
MVSNQLRPAPEPLAQPAPSQFPAWNDPSARPFGGLPYARLETQLAEADRRAAEADRAATVQSRKAEEMQAESMGSTLGQRFLREATALLEQADQLARVAEREGAAAVQTAEEAATARHVRDRLTSAQEKSRLALRLVGTSRAEQQQLLAGYTERMATAYEEGQRARAAATSAGREAWQTIRTSRYAEILPGATDTPPREVAEMRRRITTMHEQLPALAEGIDTQRTDGVRQNRQRAVELRTGAAEYRTTASGLRAELELRSHISSEAPNQHTQESAARDAALRDHRTPAPQQPSRTSHQMAAAQRGPSRTV